MTKCEKCKRKEGTECVYYSEYESYLCKSCYKKWLKLARAIPDNCKILEKRYLEWLKEEKNV